MQRLLLAIALTALLAVVAGCGQRTTDSKPAHEAGSEPAASTAPPSGLDLLPPQVVERGVIADHMIIDASDVVVVDLADLPPATKAERRRLEREGSDDGPELPISKEEAERRRRESLKLLPQDNIQVLPEEEDPFGPAKSVQAIGTGSNNGTLGNGTASHDASSSCQGCALQPPDPEMAAGPDHVIAVNNISFQIITRASGVKQSFFFTSFFAGTPNCAGVFDPNVVYDEKSDRFVLGIDANGTHYCVAANATSGNVNVWNLYSFQTVNNATELFDYPHAGVGADGIYVGANMFTPPVGGQFFQGRTWAIRKSDLYNAVVPLSVVQANVGGESTPQPANIKGTFPAAGRHYFLTDNVFDGNTYAVWRWDNAVQSPPGNLVRLGVVDLSVPMGIPGNFPVPTPQSGGMPVDGGDFRVQDNEQRKGKLHMTTTIACNPGAGTVNCVRWAVIDPTGPSIVDMGVFGSNSRHRIYSDLAVDSCGNIAVGYSRSASTEFAAVYLTGRQPTDPAGLMQNELLCKAGEAIYTGPPSLSSPFLPRWGDYSGMTVAPDNTFFYLGEYAKSQQNMAIPGFTSANWGTYVCSFGYGCGCKTFKKLNVAVNQVPIDPVEGLTTVDPVEIGEIVAQPRQRAGCSQPTHPDKIVRGLDFFETPPGGGQVDVGVLPAGFFCEEQARGENVGTLPLHGVPLLTSPANVLGNTDTVVERPQNVVISPGGEGSTTIRIRALSLESDDTVTVASCPVGQDRWRAKVSLTGAAQVPGTITIRREQAASGTFDATFTVDAQVVFVNADDPAQMTAPISQVDVVSTLGAEWAKKPTDENAVAHCGDISIDSNCDGLINGLDYSGSFAKMTNFWPGWPGGGGVQHTGPHPSTLPPICP